MKPGTKRQAKPKLKVLGLVFCCLVMQLLTVVEVRGEARASMKESVLSLMEKEAYFYFFLEDYLNAATHFKLLEEAAMSAGETEVSKMSRYLLGSLYLSWGMHHSAFRIFNALLDGLPEGEQRYEVFLAIERMQYRRAQYRSVLKTYQRLEMAPPLTGLDEGAYLAGMSHHAIGEMGAGNAELARILPESRFYPFAQMALGKSYFSLGETPKSLHLLEQLSFLNTRQNPLLNALKEKARLTQGHILIEAKRYGRAYSVLSKIPEQSSFYPDAMFGMAWAKFKETDYLAAILVFEDLIEFAPQHLYALEALTALGHVYNRLEAYGKAIDQYSHSVTVYAAAEKALRDFQLEIKDVGRLSKKIDGGKIKKQGLLAELIVEDDGVRYWVSEYQALHQLATLLEEKKQDLDVFEVMADHREKVFRESEEKIALFYSPDFSVEKKNKVAELKNRLNQAIREEHHALLWTPEEANILRQLADAQNKSVAIERKIQKLLEKGLNHPDLLDLRKKWEQTKRWLKIARGEQFWNLSIAVPGRVDDLKREAGRLQKAYNQLEANQAQLQAAVPVLKLKIGGFHNRIQAARKQLEEKHRKVLRMQQAILPALQGKLLEASERRLKRLMAWTSAAELSRLQILDVQGLN